MTEKKRVFTLMLAAMVCFVVLFSSIFIVSEADHDCTGEDCPICYQISICKNTLKTLSNVVIIIVSAVVLTYSFFICCTVLSAGKRIESLVSLKVKLSN